MSSTDPIEPVSNGVSRNRKLEENQPTHPTKEPSAHPPASPLAVPVETARAEVNAASFMTAMMMPTRDGIYSIGAISVKVGNFIRKIAHMGGWGFWTFIM